MLPYQLTEISLSWSNKMTKRKIELKLNRIIKNYYGCPDQVFVPRSESLKNKYLPIQSPDPIFVYYINVCLMHT